MKNVVIVAPHFPPSNLAAVHRARLWAQHLAEFGWKPTILATHWDHYEEALVVGRHGYRTVHESWTWEKQLAALALDS